MKEITTIFDLIASVTSRTEPFHSRLLAWLLDGDQQFIRSFLEAFVPTEFLVENAVRQTSGEIAKPVVEAERAFPNGERLDVLLAFERADIAIEVKTVDGSASDGQLNSYWKHLACTEKAVFLIYITPFNSANLPDGIVADRLHAVREFQRFENEHPAAGVHINWEQVIRCYPAEPGPLFENLFDWHSDYIKRIVCDQALFHKAAEARELGRFFGEETVHQFFTELKERGIRYVDAPKDIVIPLRENFDKITDIAAALFVLIESEDLDKSKEAKSRSDVTGELLARFSTGVFAEVYAYLFAQFLPIRYLWLQGKDRIGVRVSHANHPGGVSVCTLCGEEIRIRQER